MDFENMTTQEAIEYCYRHKDDYIRSFDQIDEGMRQFECLIPLVEDGTVKPEALPDYGMDYPEEEATSRNTHRLTQNPLEASFLETWENDPSFAKTLDYILSGRRNEIDGTVTNRDREVAATVIQWLGSPVGQCFLETALKVEVRKLIPKKLMFNPDA